MADSGGCVGDYCHGNKIGTIVALDVNNLSLARDIAMHITACSPIAISISDVPSDIIKKESDILYEKAKGSNKPSEIIDKIVKGQVAKHMKEIVLEEQGFVKDPKISVGEILKSNSARVLAFVKFVIGEGVNQIHSVAKD